MTIRQFQSSCCAVGMLTMFFGTAQPAAADLLAEYLFEGNADDSSGNGLHGTLFGTAAIVNDPVRGMVLDVGNMVGNYVDISDPNGLLDFGSTGPNQGSATVATWVYSDEFTVHDPIFNQGEWRNGIGLNIKPDDDNHLWVGCESPGCPGNESHNSDVGVPVGVWSHVAATWSYDPAAGDPAFGETTLTFYLNGEEIGFSEGGAIIAGRATSPVDNDGDGVGNSRIGSEWRNDDPGALRWPFSGRIDELRVFDTALSASEVAALVPEPSSALIIIMAIGIGALFRRKR